MTESFARPLEDLLPEIRTGILAEVAAFSTSRNPSLVSELTLHLERHLAELSGILRGEDRTDLLFVTEQAKIWAQQKFPLEAMLRSYRCIARHVSAIEPSPRVQDYVDDICAVAAAAYVRETRLSAIAEGDRQRELFQLLVSGFDEADSRMALVLRQSGLLDHHLDYCVAAVRAVNASEMNLPERVGRIVTAVSDAAATSGIRLVSGVHEDAVVAIFTERRRVSGWTAPSSLLAGKCVELLALLGPAVFCGVSTAHPSTAFIPRALREARAALDFASFERRVVGFGSVPLRDFLIHNGKAFVQEAQPAWAAAFLAEDTAAKGVLLQTLKAMAMNDLNIQKAARQLGRHPNTIYGRLEKIAALTGLNGARFHELSELLLVAECCAPIKAAKL